jgi:hypothetical protein
MHYVKSERVRRQSSGTSGAGRHGQELSGSVIVVKEGELCAEENERFCRNPASRFSHTF